MLVLAAAGILIVQVVGDGGSNDAEVIAAREVVDAVIEGAEAGDPNAVAAALGENGVFVGINTVEYDTVEVVDFLTPFLGEVASIEVIGDPVRTQEGIAFPVVETDTDAEAFEFFMIVDIDEAGNVRFKEQGFLPPLAE